MTYSSSAAAMAQFELVNGLIIEDEVATSLLEKLLQSAENCFLLTLRRERRIALSKSDVGKSVDDGLQAVITDLRALTDFLNMKYGDDVRIFSKPGAIDDPEAVDEWIAELLGEFYRNRKI